MNRTSLQKLTPTAPLRLSGWRECGLVEPHDQVPGRRFGCMLRAKESEVAVLPNDSDRPTILVG